MVLVSAAVRIDGRDKQHFMIMVPLDMHVSVDEGDGQLRLLECMVARTKRGKPGVIFFVTTHWLKLETEPANADVKFLLDHLYRYNVERMNRACRQPGVGQLSPQFRNTSSRCLTSALCDERDSFASAERYRGDDAPAVVDSLPPPPIVAVGTIPGPLFADFPSLAHVARICFEKALRLKRLQAAVDFNSIMTGAAVEPSTGACIHAAPDVSDGRAEFIFVERPCGEGSHHQSERNG